MASILLDLPIHTLPSLHKDISYTSIYSNIHKNKIPRYTHDDDVQNSNNHYYYENQNLNVESDGYEHNGGASSLHIYMPTRLDSSNSGYDIHHHTNTNRLHSNSMSSMSSVYTTFNPSNSHSNSNSSGEESDTSTGIADIDIDIDTHPHHNIYIQNHTHDGMNLIHSDTSLLDPLPSLQLKPHPYPYPVPIPVSLHTPTLAPMLTSTPPTTSTTPLNTATSPTSNANANANTNTNSTPPASTSTSRSTSRSTRMNTRRRGSNGSSNRGSSSNNSIGSASLIDDISSTTHTHTSSLSKPYDRHEYRKLRHRETDTNRRIRIKNLLEELRTIIYTNKNIKVEQSQIIQDSLVYIDKLKEENFTLKQRVETLEKQMEQIHINTTEDPVPVTVSESTITQPQPQPKNQQVHSDADSVVIKNELLNNSSVAFTNADNSSVTHIDRNHTDVDHSTPLSVGSLPPTSSSSSSFLTAIPVDKSNATTNSNMYPVNNENGITIYRIPEPMRNMNIAIWITSLDGQWKDMNNVFQYTTKYKYDELQNRYAAEYPAYVTSILREDDPYDTQCQIETEEEKSTSTSTSIGNIDYSRNQSISTILSTNGEVPLGLGCKLYTDSWIFQRASQTPLLFNAYWLDAKKRRRATKFMARVMMDERDMKPAYILNIYYR